MIIIAFYSYHGSPAIGLIPTIRIRRLYNGLLVVTDESMIEIGDGWYKYDYDIPEEVKGLVIRCDAGSDMGNDRYVWGAYGEHIVFREFIRGRSRISKKIEGISKLWR